MQYVIRTDEPFRGHCQSVLNPDGTVAYTDALTVAEYQKECGFPICVVSEAKMAQLVWDFEQTLKTKPKPITKERYWEMLEVLPPCRWHNAGGFEVFHVSEHLTGPLVSWFAHRGAIHQQYWEFVDDCRLTDEALVEMLTRETKASRDAKIKLGDER